MLHFIIPDPYKLPETFRLSFDPAVKKKDPFT